MNPAFSSIQQTAVMNQMLDENLILGSLEASIRRHNIDRPTSIVAWLETIT
jgi:hypothetical protein